MRYITDLYRDHLVPPSVHKALSAVYQRRIQNRKPEIADVGFSIESNKFEIHYVNGKCKSYSHLESFLQAIGFSIKLGEFAVMSRYMQDPETYAFEEELLNNTIDYLNRVTLDVPAFVDALEFRMTPFAHEYNADVVGRLWNDKYQRVGLSNKLPKSMRYRISCMDGSELAELWAVPQGSHRLATLETEDGLVFARSIIHLDHDQFYNNMIYVYESCYPNDYNDYIQELLLKRMKCELLQLCISPLNKPIAEFKQDFLVGWKYTVARTDLISFYVPAVPCIDNPANDVNLITGLKLFEDVSTVVSIDKATHIFIPFENVCLPLLQSQKNLLQEIPRSMQYQIATHFSKEMNHFMKEVNHVLRSNPNIDWEEANNFEFDMNVLVNMEDYDQVLSICASCTRNDLKLFGDFDGVAYEQFKRSTVEIEV